MPEWDSDEESFSKAGGSILAQRFQTWEVSHFGGGGGAGADDDVT